MWQYRLFGNYRLIVISEPIYGITHLYLYILNFGSTNVIHVIPEIAIYHYGKKDLKSCINYNFSEKTIMTIVEKTALRENVIGKA